MLIEPTTIDELQQAIRVNERTVAVGAGTKPALSSMAESWQRISTRRLTGIVEYESTEFTITVRAGTPLAEIEKALDENGQYLPFDPPLAAEGATVGGTVAAGLSGPGAFRYGPIRDFLIGVRFIDGDGRLITGGGKVVKNAAGFDFPKFLIGSCGRLGILAELTFKVFPKPPASVTFGIAPRNLTDAIFLLQDLSKHPYELDALEYEPSAEVVWGRIRGNPDALSSRLEQIDNSLRSDHFSITICESSEADYFWEIQRGLKWADPDSVLAKVALTPDKIERLQGHSLAASEYSMGGNVAWVNGTPGSIDKLWSAGWNGQILRGQTNGDGIPGNLSVGQIHNAVKEAFDPNRKFPPLFSLE